MNPNPDRSYKIKLLLFALLPFAYVFTVLAVVFALFGLLVWTIVSGEDLEGALFRIELALVVIAALFLRAILVRMPRPEGLTLGEQDAARLFAMVREIEQMLGGPKVHAILLTDQFAVTLSPSPSFSLLGWPMQYYLKIGLPLMHALAPEPFKAIVAGEIGQFASTYDWFGSWINARRSAWTQLLSALVTRGGWGRWSFSRFFNWYALRFNFYALTLLRQHQFEADALAARATAAETAADALIRMEFASYVEYEYWENEDEGVVRLGPPNVAKLVETAIANDEAKAWLDSVLEASTSPRTASPSLRERLAALEQEPRPPSPIAESAAHVFLGDRLDDLTERLEIWDQERTGTCRSQQPDVNAEEALAFGNRLLAEDREEGVSFVHRAIEMDSELSSIGLIHLSSYYMRKGDIVTANRYSRQSTDRWQLLAKAQAERTHVSFVDRFLTQSLPDFELEQLRSELAKHERVKAAYLVRKDVRYLPEVPLHALALVLDRPWFSKANDDLLFAKRLPPALKRPQELYTFVLDYRNRRLGNAIRNVSGSLIFRRR